jgi:hypothetical protein
MRVRNCNLHNVHLRTSKDTKMLFINCRMHILLYPIGSRFIVGVAGEKRNEGVENDLSIVEKLHNASTKPPQCSTTVASKWLDAELKKVMQLLETKNKKLIAEHGISRYWRIEDMDKFFYDLKVKDSLGKLKGKRPRTTDFTTMYTSLSQLHIINNLKIAVREAFDFNDQCDARHHQDMATFEKITKHVEFIVKNTYIANDPENIRHQTKGIPMGTNCAPRLANLTLYVDEAKFVDGLLIRNQINEAKLHCHTKRFIDDMITFGVAPPEPRWYDDLQHTETTKDFHVEFLGAKIRTKEDGHLQLWVFDKFDEWSFSVIKYPHADSNTSAHQAPGIVTGQLLRFRNIINTVTAFKEATTKLVVQMLKRKHSTIQIYKGWENHLKRFQGDRYMNYDRLRIWFRRMINWAFHHSKEENPIQMVQDDHAPINLAAFPRSPEPAIDENASDADIIQIPAVLPDTSIAVPVISSPDLSDHEPASSPMRPAPNDQLPPEPITPLQTDRSANLGSTEATNNLVTPQSTDQSVPIQVEPAPARRRRVSWRESLEDVRILVYPSRLPARIRNPTNFLTMSTFSNRTQNHESLPASSSQE